MDGWKWISKVIWHCVLLILSFAITAALTIRFLREVIVQGSVRWPNGLALDLVLDRL